MGTSIELRKTNGEIIKAELVSYFLEFDSFERKKSLKCIIYATLRDF